MHRIFMGECMKTYNTFVYPQIHFSNIKSNMNVFFFCSANLKDWNSVVTVPQGHQNILQINAYYCSVINTSCPSTIIAFSSSRIVTTNYVLQLSHQQRQIIIIILTTDKSTSNILETSSSTTNPSRMIFGSSFIHFFKIQLCQHLHTLHIYHYSLSKPAIKSQYLS